MSDVEKYLKPEVIVFAGPNGSGKSTITKMAKTVGVYINVARVKIREASGGHGVPEEKVRSRYYKALSLVPQLVDVCDILHVYDNTDTPFRIFKKRKDVCFQWENDYWSNENIAILTGIHN